MQPKNYSNPKIALLNIELELKAERDNAEVRVESVEVSRVAFYALIFFFMCYMLLPLLFRVQKLFYTVNFGYNAGLGGRSSHPRYRTTALLRESAWEAIKKT